MRFVVGVAIASSKQIDSKTKIFMMRHFLCACVVYIVCVCVCVCSGVCRDINASERLSEQANNVESRPSRKQIQHRHCCIDNDNDDSSEIQNSNFK